MAKGSAGAADAQGLVDALVAQWPAETPYGFKPRTLAAGKALFEAPSDVRKGVVLALLPLIERTAKEQAALSKDVRAAVGTIKPEDPRYARLFSLNRQMRNLSDMLADLLRAKLTFTIADADALFGWIAKQTQELVGELPTPALLKLAEQLADQGLLTTTAHGGLKTIRKSQARIPTAANHRAIEKIDKILAKPPAKPATKPPGATVASSSPKADAAPVAAASGAEAPRLVDALLAEWPDDEWHVRVVSLKVGKAILKTTGKLRAAVAIALLPAITKAHRAQLKVKPGALRLKMVALQQLPVTLLNGKPPMTSAEVDALFGWLAKQTEDHLSFLPQEDFVALARQYCDGGLLTPKAHAALKVMRKFHKGVPSGASERLVAAVDELLAPAPKAKPSSERAAAPSAEVKAARAEAQWLVVLLPKSWPKDFRSRYKAEQSKAAKVLLAADAAVRKQAVFILLDWLGAAATKIEKFPGVPEGDVGVYTRTAVRDIIGVLLRGLKLAISPDDAARMFEIVAGRREISAWTQPVTALVGLAERMHEAGTLTDRSKEHLSKLRRKLEQGYTDAEARKLIARLGALVDDGGLNCVAPGEAWSDQALADYAKMKGASRSAWTALLTHAARATSAKPSEKWETEAAKLLGVVGGDAFTNRVLEWFPLVEKPRTAPWPHRYAHSSQTELMITDSNADVLRGLAWMCAAAAADDKGANSADVCRALGRLCETSLKKLAGMGPRLPKLANAAVYALGKIAGEHALGQLARLKTRVTFRTTLQQIEKALDDAAARLGVTKSDLEELGVPAYGFDEAGVRRETFDGVTCELKLDGRKVITTWTNEKGKVMKGPPAVVKEKHADDLKELKLASADAEKMLTAQRDRIDGVMGLPKTWKLEDLRTRYLEHPLVVQIARRLIWIADGTPVLFIDGEATDVKGKPVKLGKTAEVSLWHPAERKIDEVVAWRRRLEALQITQPFKQAHREVYLLTDAERRTRTYSNRFAAHVIRQHQFHALAAQRGWRNKLRLMVDDTFPPASKALPQFDLRAEFWVEGVGDDYGTDTLDSGAYLRLTTDQVRFYRGNAEQPLPLEQVPPLAFSEIMRDVDLFVGVASVANDPTWQDGGPGGRYRDYWSSYAFGDLTETARTRKAVLERLVPRLKIADRARLTDKFLVVRGDVRTYKIHLGSGNILMEPNDQYLCIVPDRATKKSLAGDAPLFLPFEGDQTLSVIISKALLLADDTKISDPTILTQIEGR